MPRTPKTTPSQAQRYRYATELILEQLDWCINYLYGIRKRGVAAALERNRDAIRSRLDAP
jgi:hypothetical protein